MTGGSYEHIDRLTPRESEVLDLLRLGLTNAEIAQRLGISVRGVKFHVSEILGKTGASDRRELARGLPARRWSFLALPALLKARPRLGWLLPAAAGAVVVAIAAGLALLAWGISRTDGGDGGSASGPAATPASAAEALLRAQETVDQAVGYHVEVNGHNLVLPQWGGIDAASLDVLGRAAEGTVERTGDGPYTIVTFDGMTVFRRDTCDHFARIPGGGPDVLRFFLWQDTGTLRQATNASYVDGSEGVVAIETDLPDLGRVRVDLDGSTYLPLRLVKPRDPDSGSETTWEFSRWNEAPAIGHLPPDEGDQGPGGNPC